MRRVSLASLAALVTAAVTVVAPPPARAEDLLDQYAATNRFRTGAPASVTITPDGAEVLYLRSADGRDRVMNLYAVDVRTGRERVLLTAQQILAGGEEKLTKEEWARRERLRLAARGLVSFQLSRDGRQLLVPLSSRLFLVERATGRVRELVPGRPGANDAKLSPDGTHVACVRDGDLYVIDVATNTERRITTRENERVSWGLPEFVAQEEMGRFEGYWWSPDSRRIAAQRTDESAVERMRIADPSDPAAEPIDFAYPRPGRTNADVRLAVFDLSQAAPQPTWVTWDRAAFPYLCAARWQEGGPLALLVMDRVQQHELLLAADAASGATRTLLEERDDVWLNLHVGAPRFLPDGRFLWIAERDDSGPWLELRAADGALLRRLTPPGLCVSALTGADAASGAAYVSATTDAFESHAWRVPLDGRSAPARLGAEAGSDELLAREGAKLRARKVTPVTGPIEFRVEDARGRLLARLRSTIERPVVQPRVEWKRVTKDSLLAVIVRPRDWDANRKYPVVDWAYAGPHSNRVVHRADGYVMEQHLADQGFIVVTVDGRGTPGRTRTFERAIRGDLIGPALADHVAGIRELCAADPSMDAARIGVTGWSFGGYYALLALEKAGEFYSAGVAGAPVVDWRDYDTFYTERYLGLPAADSLAYARSSGLTDAAKLTRPLLVIHGTADDKVYFFNSMRLADALNRAGRDFDFMPMPGQTHGPTRPADVRRVYTRLGAYLREHLGAPTDGAPPRP
ncbi:MAG: DPP IV N-terminal domain-containing protein [Candidatus Eisenbacteria bacterium]